MTHLRLIRGNAQPEPPITTRDLPQLLEDAAHAAHKCGQPVLLTPDKVLEIALLLRLGSVA